MPFLPRRPTPAHRRAGPAVAVVLAATLAVAACGGGGGGGDTGTAPPDGCSVAEQKTWLRDYMADWYFWARLAPRPAPEAFPDLDGYFQALLYTGGDLAFPADRWSRSESSVSFDRFYGEGRTLGYGVSVAGLEVLGEPTRPLFVRHVEALSPAAAQGIQRGDEVLAINGRAVAELIAANDFAALNAALEGESLALQLRREGSVRTVTLAAAVFTLTPVSAPTVIAAASGRRIGYVAVKDMIAQGLPAVESAFAQLRAEGVNEVLLDLRYNGGGLVSTGAAIASHVAGARGEGKRYARLVYNDQRSASNQAFAFTQPAAALGLPRAYVLTGRRTCSASEQVINGLRGAGVQVVTVGEASCGKPVGSLPTKACDRTYSVINFESVNEAGEGRYFDGFAPVCAVAEDFTVAQGTAADPLFAAARQHAETGLCPAPLAGLQQPLAWRPVVPVWRGATDERDAMLPR